MNLQKIYIQFLFQYMLQHQKENNVKVSENLLYHLEF